MSFEVRFKLGNKFSFFLYPMQCAISQFILTILVFMSMVWALMRSFKISCWLHENFQWVTRTIHTLHLLVKDIISASSHRHKQGLARAKVACRKQHQSVHWSEETEYIIPAHSETASRRRISLFFYLFIVACPFIFCVVTTTRDGLEVGTYHASCGVSTARKFILRGSTPWTRKQTFVAG